MSAPVRTHPYQLGPEAEPVFTALGVDLAAARSQRRPLLRFCVDWSEQRHHLSGALGAALLTRMESAGWLVRHNTRRTLQLTDSGAHALDRILGVELAA